MKLLVSTVVSHLRPGIVLLAIFAIVLGGAYPAIVGAMIEHGLAMQIANTEIRDPSGHLLASALSGPAEERPQYFWGRIYGPGTRACADAVGQEPNRCKQIRAARFKALRAGDPGTTSIPPELLIIASSNLTPEISVAAARYQAPRVARFRGLSLARVQAVIDASTRNSVYNTTKGLYVNVLELNLRLDGKLA